MSTRPPDKPDFYTFQEACKILNVSPRTLRKAIAAGTIPALVLGPKTVRIPRHAIEATTTADPNPYPWLGA